MAEAAKAPAARWNNCRRGRFITMLPGNASGSMQIAERHHVGKMSGRGKSSTDPSLLVTQVSVSRPHGAVITKRYRGPCPVRRSFGQLHGWLEVAEPAGW